ncbi:MAG: hypothetical protein ACRDRH_05480 [Pseudonocardia sp.]
MTDPNAVDRYRRPRPEDVPDLATVGEQAEFDAMSEKSQVTWAAPGPPRCSPRSCSRQPC